MTDQLRPAPPATGAPSAGLGTAVLEVDDLGRVFRRGDREVHALSGVSFRVDEGEFVTVVGPSGCGKSTLLHILGGFDAPTSGVARLRGHAVEGPDRDRGVVFQQPLLYDWWTVARNVAWPVELGGADRATARRRAGELLSLVGLDGFEGAYPSELSGGMQQRAAIARTLALDPDILLMDEPFGALDAQTRELMQEELNRIVRSAGRTVLFITHDIFEAVFLGDRVLVMGAHPGRIVESIDVDLPRPRSPESKRSEAFLAYHNRIWDHLHDEAAAAERARATTRGERR